MTATPRAAPPSALPPVETPEAREDMRLLVAGQWQLMWWRFRKHKVAMVATAISLLIYLVAVFASFWLRCHATTTQRTTRLRHPSASS